MHTVSHSTSPLIALARLARRAHFAALLLATFVMTTLALPSRALEQADMLNFGTGFNRSESILVHPGGGFAYVITSTGPGTSGQLIKVDLATFEPVDSVGIAGSGDQTSGPFGVIDTAGAYAYVAYTGNAVPYLAKIDLAMMMRVAEAPLTFSPASLVMDAAGAYAYTGSDEGIVEKIDLANMLVVGQVQTGQIYLRSATIAPTGTSAYFGTFTIPGKVVKIDLVTFQWEGLLTLGEGEVGVKSAVIDPSGSAAYFGTYTSPGRVIKVDLATFQRADGIALGANENYLRTMTMDPSGAYAYAGTTTYPPRIIKIDLATFLPVASTMLGADSGGLISLATDINGAFAYAGTDDSPGNLVKVALLDPAPDLLTLDPPYLDFYNVELGSSSALRNVTLRNDGLRAASALQFGGLPSAFSVDASDCGLTLAAGATCELHFTFTPGKTGVTTARWGASGAEGATAHMTLRGNGALPSQGLSLTPAVLDFGPVDLGTTSAPMTAMLTNTGSTSLFVFNFSSGNNQAFTVNTSNCNGDNLLPGASCAIEVTFRPTVTTPTSDSLRIQSGESETQLALAGSGIRHPYSLIFEQPTVNFGSVAVGQVSHRSLTLRNFGTNEVTNVTVTTSDERFIVTDVLCSSLAPTASCIVDVSFAPDVSGAADALLLVTTSEGATAQAQLSGIGTGDGQPAHLVFQPEGLDFGEVAVGATSEPRVAQLLNDGTGVAVIENILAMDPEFNVDSSACGPSLPPGTGCEISVRFMPLLPMKTTGFLTVTTNQGTSAVLSMTGTGSLDLVFRNGFD